MRAKCRTHERRKPMNDKMTPDKERENCPCRKAIINPFDAMMMVVVRRLDKAYLELKRSKPPAKEAEFALRNAKLSFYGELVRQSMSFPKREMRWRIFTPVFPMSFTRKSRNEAKTTKDKVRLWRRKKCIISHWTIMNTAL